MSPGTTRSSRGDDPAATIGPIGPEGSTDVASLIDVLIEEQIGPAPSEQTSLRRAVSMLVHASLADDRRRAWLDGMVPAGGAAYRSALSRARRRADADPRIADIAGHIGRLAA